MTTIKISGNLKMKGSKMPNAAYSNRSSIITWLPENPKVFRSTGVL